MLPQWRCSGSSHLLECGYWSLQTQMGRFLAWLNQELPYQQISVIQRLLKIAWLGFALMFWVFAVVTRAGRSCSMGKWSAFEPYMAYKALLTLCEMPGSPHPKMHLQHQGESRPGQEGELSKSDARPLVQSWSAIPGMWLSGKSGQWLAC